MLLALLVLTLIPRVSQAQTFLPGTKFGINDDSFHGFYGYDDAASMQRAADAWDQRSGFTAELPLLA